MAKAKQEYFSIGAGGGALKECATPVKVGLKGDLFVMAGPCVIESRKLCLSISEKLVEIGRNTGVPMIFKASFDKADRSSTINIAAKNERQ
jgi:3-deoxy-D-manno-octulosonic acid (KDO) 8-phosphate synthase